MKDYQKPLPAVNEDTAPFWSYCRQHELRMQQCKSCSHIRFPASILCPICHDMEANWVKLSGDGIVYSYIIYRKAYHPTYESDIPYVVAIIQLKEGPRMESNIVSASPEEISIGMPVKLFFQDVNDEFSLPKFRMV